MTTKRMNHTDYPKSLRNKTVQELAFIQKDAAEAIAANPENPNNSYYADEVIYAGMELTRRRKV